MCLNLMGHLCLRSHQHSVPISITWQGQTERPLYSSWAGCWGGVLSCLKRGPGCIGEVRGWKGRDHGEKSGYAGFQAV